MDLKQPQNECFKHEGGQCSTDPIEADITNDKCVVDKEVIEVDAPTGENGEPDTVTSEALDEAFGENQTDEYDEDSDDEEQSNARYRKTATILVILCLINMVVYIKILAEILLTTNWETELSRRWVNRVYYVKLAIDNTD